MTEHLLLYAISLFISYRKLYFTSVLVGCGSYVLCQLLRMAMKRSLNGAGYLLVGGAVGGASYAGVRVFWCWFCNILGPWSIQVKKKPTITHTVNTKKR